MVRTQVQLTERQIDGLRRRSAARGVSMAQLVREAVDHALLDDRPTDAQLRARALEAVGGARSGLGDLAAEHDGYLAARR